MKILIAPDSFKGTLTSEEVCQCIENGIKSRSDNLEIISVPLADGGEGFGKCLANICKADTLYIDCCDIYENSIKAPIYTYKNTAIIECAYASGLQRTKDVMNATSYGTGMLIKSAVEKGFSNIILGLGGTGCCDGGSGILSALGAKFQNIFGKIITVPKGKDLNEIHLIDYHNIVKGITFTYACDVENPLCGKNGASYVFAKQKGATDDQVVILDNGLKKLSTLLPTDVQNVKGAGAAGGICAGLYSIYHGEIKSGFDILSHEYSLEKKISECDIVITGEGRTDSQTLMGKLPYKIYQLAKKYNKKCYVISGSIQDVSFGHKMISVTDDNTSIKDAIKNPKKTLTDKAKLLLQ